MVEDSSNEDGDSKEDKVDELALLEQLLTSSVQPDFCTLLISHFCIVSFMRIFRFA